MTDGKARFEKYILDNPPLNKQALLRACFSLQKFRLLLGDTEINVHLEVTQANADYVVKTLTRWGVKEIRQNWKAQIERTLCIQGISIDDCLNYTGEIEKGDAIRKVSELKQPETVPSKFMTFGKFKGKPYVWIREHQPNYWSWLIENIEGFRKKVAHLG